jgi:hypothetical protein
MDRIHRAQLSREEIIAEIKACTEKLGHAPSLREFKGHADITHRYMRKQFGTWTGALRASGIRVERRGPAPADMETLFRDWAEVTRKLGRVPTQHDYDKFSKFSVRPLTFRFQRWRAVPEGMMQYAEKSGLNSEYQDVADIVTRHEERQRTTVLMHVPPAQEPWKAQMWTGRPVYGAPSSMAACEPASEEGVIFLFGMLAKSLGFSPTRIQKAFPDCEAFCRVEDGKWQLVKVEFELESVNFRHHLHDPSGCDVIVCWVHNWLNCPLPVIELKREMRRLVMAGEL